MYDHALNQRILKPDALGHITSMFSYNKIANKELAGTKLKDISYSNFVLGKVRVDEAMTNLERRNIHRIQQQVSLARLTG